MTSAQNTTSTQNGPRAPLPPQAPLPPLAPGLPLLGSALEMYTDVLGYLVKTYHRLGPIFRVKILNETYTVIAGPEANLFMARQGNEHFRSKEFWEELDHDFGVNHSLISSDGELHARLRQLEKRGYSRGVIEKNLGEAAAIARAALDAWPAGDSRPVYPFLQDVITDQLGKMIVGRMPGDYTRDVVNYVRTSLLVLVTHQRPRMLLATPAHRRARRRAFELGQQIIDWHRAHPPLDREANLIDDALEAAREGEIITEKDLLPIALGPYIAGLDTAASTAASLMYALFSDPSLLDRARAEAAELFAGEGPTPQKMRQLDVLHRAVLETLRRYPIAPAVQRTVIKPFDFSGYTVEAGQRIFIGTTVPHFSADLHPDPYRFDIDRYLPERAEHRIPGAFAPFSLGAHTCLGAGLAEVQMMLTAAVWVNDPRFEVTHPGRPLKMRTAPTPAPDNSFEMRKKRSLD